MLHLLRGSHRLHVHAHHGGAAGGRGPKRFDAGAMRYVVLQLIADKPRHGYEIIKAIEQRAGGGYAPSPGAIYPLLAMLLDLGHVSATPDGNKKLHSITPEGLVFLQDNRQYADAILARMDGAGEHCDDLRHLMHQLKEAVASRVHLDGPTTARADGVRAILRQAIRDIDALK
ncbi:PadR family transcriptional regulator [Janthinobacterium agaricidamnosum]|uniref:Transcriptional regulator PadR-like family protein n=1 Tax=Janthinobacterium agaricidamnosum NBRC 102515 = DSM 9628 TaxID=1349767 RepID=W0V1H0_9BURK|nr:PadR family transcriptional regulator [Janthinobacterium agaricidamnosum]CDG81726.1 transcriptional regulator PadR-like family protein [Janthinobacterium agaricidamnosum NBRC 102515 = DSM 9628]